MSTTQNYYSQQQQNPQNVKPGSEQPGYVQQAADLLSNATATVASYIPAGVSNAAAGVAQKVQPDPTKQYRNKMPHVGGVGDLGTDSTEDVTLLPEERIHPDRTTMTGITRIGGHPGSPGGVGDLGTEGTTDVVRLPEEREHPDPFSSSAADGMQGTLGTYGGVGGHPGARGGVGDLGTTDTEGVAMLPEEQSATSAAGLGGHGGRHHDITKDGSAGGHTGGNYDVDHGLGMPHARSMKPSNDTTERSREDSTGRDAQTGAGATERRGSSGECQSPKEAGYPTGKPSLMDKVKGTAMATAAKIGHKNEDKLHQAQMLKETGKMVNPEEEARRAGTNV